MKELDVSRIVEAYRELAAAIAPGGSGSQRRGYRDEPRADRLQRILEEASARELHKEKIPKGFRKPNV